MTAAIDLQYEAIPLSIGETNSVELPYRIRGVADELAAGAALLSLSPDVYGGLPKLTGSIKSRASASIFFGTVTYGSPTKQKEDDQQLSFKTGGGTQKIIRSLGTTRYGPKAPDMGGLINVTANGVEGVEVHVPTLEFTIRRGFALDFVTNDYVKMLAGLTGSVNDDEFNGFAAGEVLFLGAEGTQSGGDPWQITFSFAASSGANTSPASRKALKASASITSDQR